MKRGSRLLFINYMKNEFQSLKMDLFARNEIQDTRFIVGGTTTTPPDGGSTCPTDGGTKTYGDWTKTYSSDTQAYQADGSNGEKDYEWTS
jgi:hypothetical protein